MKKGPSLLVRFTIYPLVAAVFLLIVAYTVFSASGYDIKIENGKIVTKETGVIIINTKPGEADVYVDGELYKKKTPSFSLFNLKINRMAVGDHDLKIEKEGYETWEGIVSVEPGLVTWGDYIVLVPQERESEQFTIPGSIKDTLVSHDKTREMVYSYNEKEKVHLITEIDATNKETRKLYEVLDKKDESYDLLSYSHDKERFLVKKTVGKNSSYVVYETEEGGSSWDLTALFGANPTTITFSPHSHDRLYILKGSSIHELNYVAKTQSAVLASNVSGIYYDPTNLLFIRESDENHSLFSLDSANEKESVIKALPASEKYRVSYLSGQDKYLVLVQDEGDLVVYSNGVNNPTLETISTDVVSYLVSPNEERVGYKKSDDYLVYDLKKEKYYEAVKGTEIERVAWLYNSSNILYLTEGGKLCLVNYDGKYRKHIFNAITTLPIVSTPDSPNIYFGEEIKDKEVISSFSFDL